MTDCNNPDILDALPDLINGRLSPLDRATLTEHIAGCATCAADAALLGEVRRAAPLAPGIDVELVVAALPRPSVEHSLVSNAANGTARNGAPLKPRSVVFRRRQAVWGVVASVAVLAIAGLSVVIGKGGSDGYAAGTRIVAQATPVNASAGVEVSPAASSQSASSGTSATPGGLPPATSPGRGAVTRENPPSASDAELTLISGVSELSDADLELLLSEMEKMEGIPADEPDPVTLELGNLEGDA